MAEDGEGEDQYYDNNYGSSGSNRKGNNLPFWGNQATMNLNPLILANITNSPYFKVNLAEVKVRNKMFFIPQLFILCNLARNLKKSIRKT